MTNLAPDELAYWIAFNQVSDIGPVRLNKILNFFGDLKNAWQADQGSLIQAGLKEGLAEKLISQRSSINPSAEAAKIAKYNLEILTIRDEGYPKLLREISNPPPLLYLRGQFHSSDEFALAVVGSRKISSYGAQVTRDLVRDLTQAGLTIVSGLALGVDTLAHQTCLETGGRTIAVLGTGPDIVYPAANAPLARRIVDYGGVLVSEFPLGTPSFKSNFPHRNRTISGLSLGTLIIEASEDSGSLITAQSALDQNREVFAVPGPIYSPNSKGPNLLIKQGATPVTSAADVLKALNLEQARTFTQAKSILGESPEETQIIGALSSSDKTVDELIKHCALDAKKINSILVSMELKGNVRRLGGAHFGLAR